MPDRPRSIWLRPERTGRGPVPEHDRARISAAAVALADADGLAAVSMRRIASVLGTGPASLYRYVDSRDELLELMADAVAGELDLSRPPSGDWRADLVALAHQLRDAYRRHPWLLDLTPGRVGIGPRAVDQLEHALAALAALDVAAGLKLEAVAMLNGIVALAVRTELAVGGTTASWSAAQAEFLGAVVSAGGHPHLAAALADARPAPEDALLDRILPRMLAGLLEG
ncbi:TetR/AcrR family transcriptional regulator [Pseudonocardia cypriaca]|uniref:TetR family transcriptional regulator n=1 Tax=Pseudonocardia cypriaca TaxID=882449 RepID=A0A543GJA2_9PSEU|nr:TetR/AcrR family transcriptional regulator C-terminal domain-containing protein [Pseudonocardia cypriaca]TQM46162.1 TetR family transcriptional regulator [Pseudonocardia cypriaca]